MKKRLIGTLLMGALFVSSTSVFVSCKDYDDDINNIVATKADKTALEEAKTALQNEINSLKTQLENVNGQITTLTNNKADKAEVTAVWASLNPLLEKAANLETRIGEAQSAIESINALLGGKLEGDLAGMTYKQALEATWAKAVAASTDAASALTQIAELKTALDDPTTGLKAVVNDLKGQVEALDAYKAKVDAIQGDYLKAADKTELLNKIDALKTELQGKIDGLNTTLTAAIATAKSEANTYADGKASAALDAAKSYTNAELAKLGVTIDGLKTDMQGLSTKVDDVAGLVNTLNVYVRQALRGLVFNMDSYYQGVEATDITVLWYRKYTLSATDAVTPEVRGYYGDGTINTKWSDAANKYTDEATAKENYLKHKYYEPDFKTRYYACDEISRVLKFQAKYYMNPSNAIVSQEAGTIKAIVGNKPFHSSTKVDATGDVIQDGEFNGKEQANCVGISPLNWETKDGLLIVDYDCTDPSAIQQITKNNAITVFATQVRVDADTTITSDFAALYKQDIRDIRISHTKTAAMIHNGAYVPSFNGTVNTHCGYCEVNEMDGMHLMQTVSEAAGATADAKFKASEEGGFAPQDEVAYNDTLDLMKMVEVHCTSYDANGKKTGHDKLADKYYKELGLHFAFELTGLFYGSNQTSESAHAAILHKTDKDGKDSIWYLRPQMPTIDGKPADWNVGDGAVGKQDRQTIGRTPIVRVKLLDANDNVLDYGYIRIKVVDRPVIVTTEYPVITYNLDSIKAKEQYCAAIAGEAFGFTQTWYQMEWDVHHFVGISQNEFEKNYDPDYQVGDRFKQFYRDATGYHVCEAVPNVWEYLGTVRYIINDEDRETSVIEWKVTEANIQDYITHVKAHKGVTTSAQVEAEAKVVRYIRFKLKDNAVFGADVNAPKYIFVALSPAGFGIDDRGTISGTIDWTGRKNPNYWYDKNSSAERSGLVEAHANVYGVEDNEELAKEPTGQTTTLSSNLSALFVGNELVDMTSNSDRNAFIKLINGGEYAGKDVTLKLEFIKNGVNSYKGRHTDGKVYNYYIKISADGQTLLAWRDADNDAEQDAGEIDQPIAKLESTNGTAVPGDDINHVKVSYQKTDNAKALLNYRAHNDLQDDLLTAFVAVKGKILTCPIELAGDPLNIRFLRPINVENVDDAVRDASVDNLQVIYLRDLVKLTDWRDQAFKTNYWFYYGITDIQIVGAPAGGKLSDAAGVKTNLSATGAEEAATKTLQEVSEMLDFKYEPKTYAPIANTAPDADAYGRLVYTNLGSTVQKFKLILPVKVKYIWGEVFTEVTVQVHHTTNNARLTK